ncbi:pyridoxamine 5'-phosphate oxidase family protein [Peribacillus kribbensis]|uniref:pyridoxamine 5'-phosphate oxidase family protein n=1 Tax=Peribacillus kribbensis TaxID=356658 RepID=UPI000419F411|nr:pyridoxamine 5'-phosphate oxidase family protein [Peribacillus kribbensis]
MSASEGERYLQKKYKTEKRAQSFYDNQMIGHLNEEMIKFIVKQEMVFISTADEKGNCDSSFRSGSAGFVRVIDKNTIIYPEYRGNGVMASLGNIMGNPHIGLLFIDFFGSSMGLHVNGKASIIENHDLNSLDLPGELAAMLLEQESPKAERWVHITIDEAYIHCSKHIPRLEHLDKRIDWGTDDEKQKGGDFFKVKSSRGLNN